MVGMTLRISPEPVCSYLLPSWYPLAAHETAQQPNPPFLLNYPRYDSIRRRHLQSIDSRGHVGLARKGYLFTLFVRRHGRTTFCSILRPSGSRGDSEQFLDLLFV